MNCLLQFQRTQKEYYKQIGYQETRPFMMGCISNVLMVALLAIGCLAASGILSATVAGWTAVGLGGGALTAEFIGGRVCSRMISILISSLFVVSIITIGALGGVGVLTSAHVGYALIGSIATQFVFYSCFGRAYAYHQVLRKEQEYFTEKNN